MTIYRNKTNNHLYIIEHLIKDICHTNLNALCGIYAYPYKHNLDKIVFINKCHKTCLEFVENNFNKVSII